MYSFGDITAISYNPYTFAVNYRLFYYLKTLLNDFHLHGLLLLIEPRLA